MAERRYLFPISLISHKLDYVLANRLVNRWWYLGCDLDQEVLVKEDTQIKHVTNLGVGSYCLFKSQY